MRRANGVRLLLMLLLLIFFIIVIFILLFLSVAALFDPSIQA